MNPRWFVNYPYGQFLDVANVKDEGFVGESDALDTSSLPDLEDIFIPAPHVDEGFVDESDASDTSSLPDLEDIFIPAPQVVEEDGDGLGHVSSDGGDIIDIVIASCIVIVIGIGMAFTMK